MESANKMKLTYTNVNGYLIPNLTYKSGEQMEQLGKYGFLRRDYLKNLKKKLTTLQAQDAEIRTYEEKIHLADQMISIDLDDGVKKNYAIFQDVLAKIK